MATTIYKDEQVTTAGELPELGGTLPPFTLVAPDLTEVSQADVSGSRVILNIFPSVDTRICATSVRRFNELAAGLDNTKVVCVSMDLPFALERFCGAEGIENVITASAFRSSFGQDYGVTMTAGRGAGLFARALVVADADGVVRFTDLTPTVHMEPDYDAALAALA